VGQASEKLRGVRETARLLEEGVPGEARVLGVSDTGATLNFEPVCELRLQVSLPGEAPYETTIRQTMPRTSARLMALGASLPVRVDADDPSVLVVDTDADWPPSLGSDTAARR
jgi:hypothetical protein